MLLGSTPQAANAALSAPAKLPFLHTKLKVPLLDDNGDNYTHITLVLKFKGLWDIVDGSTPALATMNAQAHLEWT